MNTRKGYGFHVAADEIGRNRLVEEKKSAARVDRRGVEHG